MVDEAMRVLRCKYPICEMNEATYRFTEPPQARLPAGRYTNVFDDQLKTRRKLAKTTRHWTEKEEFRMNPPPQQEYRRDPYYTGYWNPVMWSDYPKQPAWTVPLPKMPALEHYNGEVPKSSCYVPHTERMDRTSFPSWFPNLPTPIRPECNPYINKTTIPFQDSWGCPAPQRNAHCPAQGNTYAHNTYAHTLTCDLD